MTIGSPGPRLQSILVALDDSPRAPAVFSTAILLARSTGAQVTMFSYPNGGADVYFTPEIQELVRAAGFAAATTSRNGFADRSSDVYALERVQVRERIEELAFALEVERFAFRPVPKAVGQ